MLYEHVHRSVWVCRDSHVVQVRVCVCGPKDAAGLCLMTVWKADSLASLLNVFFMLSGPSKESLPLPFLSYLSSFVVYFPNSLQFVYWSCTSPWTWSLPIPGLYYQFPVSALCAGIIGSCRSSTVLCGFQIPLSRPHICPSDLSAALSSQSLAVISTWICYQTLDNYMWITEPSIAFLWRLWVSPNLYTE